MNWITGLVRPKFRGSRKNDTPENLWQKCPSCQQMLFHKGVKDNAQVCENCQHHFPFSIEGRLNLLFDDQNYEIIETPVPVTDPLKFKDRKKYTERLKEYQSKTSQKDAITVAKGKIEGHKTVIALFNFSFMGGSMGIAVGEGIVTAAQTAVEEQAALLIVPASGGARMQEGILSLMQMPRTTIAVEMVRQAKLPYLVLLTNPTTGGVTASFAMLGDIAIAEPGAVIGFAGARVIKETIREELPEGFQSAEFLLEHGIIDLVVHRHKLKGTIGNILSLLMTPQKELPEKEAPEEVEQDLKEA